MNHTYIQETGEWIGPDGKLLFLAYAGHGEGLNNPVKDSLVNLGPAPRGLYTIGALEDPEGKRGYGPGYLHLWPDPTNNMKGRSGFLVHWDRSDHLLNPHAASSGCIIPYDGREIAKLGAHPVKVLLIKASRT